MPWLLKQELVCGMMTVSWLRGRCWERPRCVLVSTVNTDLHECTHTRTHPTNTPHYSRPRPHLSWDIEWHVQRKKRWSQALTNHFTSKTQTCFLSVFPSTSAKSLGAGSRETFTFPPLLISPPEQCHLFAGWYKWDWLEQGLWLICAHVPHGTGEQTRPGGDEVHSSAVCSALKCHKTLSSSCVCVCVCNRVFLHVGYAHRRNKTPKNNCIKLR